jgi:hypothetical protein
VNSDQLRRTGASAFNRSLFPVPVPSRGNSHHLPGSNYPWRCLCFAFSQITRTTPWRVMTLHLTQIFFTDARTFIAAALLHDEKSDAVGFLLNFQP